MPELMGASPAQTSFWPSLDELVDEISSLDRPPFRYLAFLDGRLFGKNLLSDGFSVPAYVWSLSHHQLVDDDSEGIEIDLVAVVLLGHHFRSHVAWSPACVREILLSVLLSDTQVSHMEIS